MKFLLVASLSVACVQGGLFDKLGEKIKDVATDAIGGITDATNAIGAGITGITTYTKELVQDLKPEEWTNLDIGSIASWPNEAIEAIPLKDFTGDMLKKIPVEKMTAFSSEQIKSIKWERIGEMTDAQWDKIPVARLAEMSWEQLQQAPLDKWEQVGIGTIDNFEVGTLVKLTGEQFAKIPANAVGSRAQELKNKIPIYQLVHLTVEQLNALGLENLDSDQLASLTDEQWEGLPADKLVKLGVKGLKAVDYDRLATLTQNGWNKIPFENIPTGIAGQKIQSIPAATAAEWTQDMWGKIPVREYIMFSGEQLSNEATLSKLSVDALAQYARSGNLDMDKLSAETKAQLMTRIKEMGMTLTEYVAEGKTVVNDVIDYDRLQGEVVKAEANLEALKNVKTTPQAEITAAETALQQAVVLENVTGQKLVSAGYLSAEDLRGVAANSPASRAAPAVLVFVAMAIALVAM